jgi:hypothetical protein
MGTRIEPPDCLVRAEQLAAEMELVRVEMGRPRDTRPDLTVKGAAPREVYFEALALFRKADRFCFERTGESAMLPLPPAPGDIQPMHVLAVIDGALTRVLAVKDRLGISEKVAAPARQDSKQPSDVLGAVARANRQLNLLLDQPFSPSDVYQQLTLAIGYAGRLLSRLPGANQPALPALERKKRPGDVYKRMWGCLGTLRTIAAGNGLSTLEADAPSWDVDEIRPSDCYDLASLVVSEVVYLASRASDLAPPYPSEFYEVGHKLPAHCYQCVGLLEAQLTAMAADPAALKL